MPEDFSYCWRIVRLHASAAPAFLVREWVSNAWKKLARARHWSFLRGELRLTIDAARAVSPVTVTRGSATVTSAGLFLAADAGRQFRVASFPSYTILARPDANTLTLDVPYGEDSSLVAVAEIFDGYATLPADFESFRIVADPYNQRRIAYWITEDQINVLDPTRINADTGPRALVISTPSPVAATLGQIRYEYWPRPTAARSYPARYNKQASRLTDLSVFSGVLADGADVLVKGALAEAARWPGTQDQPNPYFNVNLARELSADFLSQVQALSLRDDDQAPDDLATVHWERWPLGDLAYNDHSLRSSDADVNDYF